MPVDMSVDLMQATVQLEQSLGDHTRTVGTGFLINDPAPDGTPRTVLVTANHVFARMPGERVTIGYRIENADGSWAYAPATVPIRANGRELWTHHAAYDVAVIAIKAPPAFAKAALPVTMLATDQNFAANGVAPGEEMMALGFPEGFSSTSAGFPILRSGRVASYPLTPAAAFPTFLLDFSVFPGNSGGPVYAPDPQHPFVAGILTQQVEGSQNLQIGIVTQARFVREALALLDDPHAHQTTRPRMSGPAGIPVAATADSAAVER
jgi:S1-C subfamily serine protease